jgi:hypothetical protein
MVTDSVVTDRTNVGEICQYSVLASCRHVTAADKADEQVTTKQLCADCQLEAAPRQIVSAAASKLVEIVCISIAAAAHDLLWLLPWPHV